MLLESIGLSVAPVRSMLAPMRKCPGLYLLLLLFFLVVAFVNPDREMMIDDDWAYGLTVRHLLATGEYKLHDWAAANMPVQIYWAGLLARLFGYSFSLLRISTLILLLIGLLAFYYLLRNADLPDIEASLLTLTLLCSPAVLFLSFTFQTDVHFLGWQILALLLYSRALRTGSYLFMAPASLAAFAAVGTRQFGVALIVGLTATWVVVEKERTRKAPLYLIGLATPFLVALWQFSFGVNRPTFSQKVRLAEQLDYIRDLPRFICDLLWRPSIILQYIALFLLPLLPLLIVLAIIPWKTSKSANIDCQTAPSKSDGGLLAAWFIYLAAAVCFGYFFYLPRILMPYLAWLLPNSQTSPFGFKKHLFLTILTCGLAAILGWLLSRRYLAKSNWQSIRTSEWFMLFSALALFGLQLLYAQFYDVYLIQFLPFVLFAMGKMALHWSRSCKVFAAVLCLITLLISSLWTRGKLAQAEANWQAAQAAYLAGAKRQNIAGNMTWSCYHGAFDEWVAQIGGLSASDQYVGSHRMHFAFFDFLNQRFDHAKYRISESPPVKDMHLLQTIPYRDGWLQHRNLYVVIQDTSK